MKKIILTLLAIVIITTNSLLLSLAKPVNALTEPTLYFDPASYVGDHVGERFNVTVKAADFDASLAIAGIQFRVKYDVNLLEAVDVFEGSFMSQFNNTASGSSTFFMNFTEVDPVYGQNVLVGILLLPNGNGSWTNFPYGSGTLATITFKVLYRTIAPDVLTSSITLDDTMVMDENLQEITHTTVDATYQPTPIQAPTLDIEPPIFTAELIGQNVEISVTIHDLDADLRLVGVQFRITYDPEVLKAVDVFEGSFMSQFNNTASGSSTFFMNFTEVDPVYGQNVLVGILLLPNGNGSWTNFPYGSGTLATITFRATTQTAGLEALASSTLTMVNTQLINDTLADISHATQDGYYQIEHLTFSHEPSTLHAGQPVYFTGPEATYPVTYTWTFGDESSLTTTEAIAGHIYASPGTYDITLTCTAYGHTSSTATTTVDVTNVNTPKIEVKVDTGAVYFKGETAEFNVLTTNYGEAIDATRIEAMLYHGNVSVANLTSSVQNVATGFYRIPYSIPSDADTGTYTLVVKAEYYNAKGANTGTFQISQMLTATITSVQNNLATIQTGLNTIRVNLTDINATLTGIIIDNKGQILARIDSSMGTLTASLDAINGKVTTIDGNTVTISTSLGDIKTKLGDVQTTGTETLYITAVLSAIAVVLAAVILIFIRKK